MNLPKVQSTPAKILPLILGLHAALLAWGAVVHSPTIDEIHTLPGGLAHWQTGRVDIVINNPPHVGLVAAIPLLLSGEETSATESTRGGRAIGRELIRANGPRSFWLFTLGRWACIPFSIAGAVGCFVWARALYGPWSGLLATTLWCFSPNILAQGQLVSSDVPAAGLGVIATYNFWRWLKTPDWTRTIMAGVALGLAFLTKMTLLVHIGLWPLLWLCWSLTSPGNRRSARDLVSQGAKLAVILLLAIDVLNVGYVFQGSFNKLSSYRFRSQSLSALQEATTSGFAGRVLGWTPVPFPRPFVEGVDFQRSVLEGRLPYQFTYLRGEWSTRGVPYFYLYALAVKVPVGTWCLLLLSIVLRVRRADGQSHVRDEIVLLAPAIVLLLTASSFLVWTDHIRHVLPAIPLAFIWISRLATLRWATHPWFIGAGTLAIVWSVASSLWVYPHSISYFNELAGGPRGGHYHLVSSNIDYGQDLRKLKQWYDQHPEARPLGLAYWDLDSVDPEVVGIHHFDAASGPAPGSKTPAAQADQFGPKPGWYAVNVNLLRGDEWPGRETYKDLGYYGYFLNFSPVARAGYSIYIYHISVAQADHVRAQLGLPPVDAATEPTDNEG